MIKFWYKDEAKSQRIISSIYLKRLGVPLTDLSGIVMLLASEASNYITGQTIYVNDGFLLQ